MVGALLNLTVRLIGFDLSRLLGGDPRRAFSYATQIFNALWQSILQLATAIDNRDSNVYSAWNDASAQISAGAEGLSRLSFNSMVAWERLLGVILPNSLHWLDGRTHQWVQLRYDWIGPELARLESDYYDFKRWIIGWRTSYVDPSLAAWWAWHDWFDGWPRGVVFRLRDYFDNPEHFTSWAWPWLQAEAIRYNSDRRNFPARDWLVGTLMQAIPAIPEATEQVAVQWLETPFRGG